jgi:hypothetical protein
MDTGDTRDPADGGAVAIGGRARGGEEEVPMTERAAFAAGALVGVAVGVVAGGIGARRQED